MVYLCLPNHGSWCVSGCIIEVGCKFKPHCAGLAATPHTGTAGIGFARVISTMDGRHCPHRLQNQASAMQPGRWNEIFEIDYINICFLQYFAMNSTFTFVCSNVLPFYICIVMYLMMWYHVEICGIDWLWLTIVHEMQDLFPTRHLHHIGRTPQALGSSGLARHGAWMVPGEWVDPLFWRRISISISENMNHIIFGIFWTCHVHLCE